MTITMVSKIRMDGTACPKCEDVKQRLEALGLMSRIDATVMADERDSQSAGALLAAQHKVSLAPFFIVEDGRVEDGRVEDGRVEDGGRTRIYTVFMRFLREVLQATPQANAAQDARDVLRANPELDLL